MRANPSFSKKIETLWNKQLGTQIRKFENTFACAGIQDDPDNAKKARINHYGCPEKNIPARQFIWAATRDLGMGQYSNEIKKIILKGIHDKPSPRSQTTTWENVGTYDKPKWIQKASNIQHGTPLTTEGFWHRLSQKMAQNQKDAILSYNFKGKRDNADSTIKKKGFNHPLVDTYEMVDSIKGWEE